MDDAALAQAINAAGLAGAVAMIAGKGGVRYSQCFGQRSRDGDAVMTPDTLFQIASMSKAITSVAALQLVEKGRLSLHAPIGDVLPGLADPQVLDGFADDGAPLLRPATTAITLHHLLTHTSGLGYDFMSVDIIRARGAAGSPAAGTLASLSMPLLFDPGDRWNYGVSTDWVGLAVEAVTGQTLGAYLEAHVTGPLGMVDTAFRPSDAQRARAASLYMRTPDGASFPLPIEIGGGDAAEFEMGGGGLWSSALDYTRFLRMILNNGTLDGVRILSPDSIASMRDNQIGDIKAGKMDSAQPTLSAPFELFPNMHCGWSYGFLINPETGPDGRSPNSLAWAGIANTHYWVDPATDTIGVFMAQMLPFGEAPTMAAFTAFERMAYQGTS
jgi:methyl acetate hydrolase